MFSKLWQCHTNSHSVNRYSMKEKADVFCLTLSNEYVSVKINLRAKKQRCVRYHMFASVEMPSGNYAN